MKKANLSISINVPDNFEPGDCESCPLHFRSSYEYAYQCYEEKIGCKLDLPKHICPISLEDNGGNHEST